MRLRGCDVLYVSIEGFSRTLCYKVASPDTGRDGRSPRLRTNCLASTRLALSHQLLDRSNWWNKWRKAASCYENHSESIAQYYFLVMDDFTLTQNQGILAYSVA